MVTTRNSKDRSSIPAAKYESVNSRNPQDHLSREISHGNTRVNRPALRLFGGGFLLCHLEHFRSPCPRDEADAGIIGEHDIAWGNSNAGNLNLTVDLNRFDTPLTGDGRYLRRPYRVADTAGVGDIADAAEDDRTCFALALAGLRGDAAHV